MKPRPKAPRLPRKMGLRRRLDALVGSKGFGGTPPVGGVFVFLGGLIERNEGQNGFLHAIGAYVLMTLEGCQVNPETWEVLTAVERAGESRQDGRGCWRCPDLHNMRRLQLLDIQLDLGIVRHQANAMRNGLRNHDAVEWVAVQRGQALRQDGRACVNVEHSPSRNEYVIMKVIGGRGHVSGPFGMLDCHLPHCGRADEEFVAAFFQ